MNVYVKQFLLRGLVFGGFGPIILGIIYASIQMSLPEFSLNGTQVFLGIVSTYLLAFLQAGASVFPQIDDWPLIKVLAIHFSTLYAAYAGCYLMNDWISFQPAVFGIFTGVFLAVYLTVWLTVYLILRSTSKKLNKALK